MNRAPSARLPQHRGAWRHPIQSLRQRLQAWFHSRLPRTDSLHLTQRNVYIVPSRPGFMLALTLLLLLVASINYQLNLGYLLTFLLAGCALVGMHVCHNNLRGLKLHLKPPAPVHAGQAVMIDVQLTSEARRERYGLGVRTVEADDKRSSSEAEWAWTNVPAQGSATVQVAWPVNRRGLHSLPTLHVQTLFPLGTFRVWTVWRPAAQVLVYPRPEAHPPALPVGEAQARASGSAVVRSTGEFDGVRAYRRGDPLKSVVWKKAAQAFATGRDQLVSRESQSSQRQELWLDHAQCGHSNREDRLSRLTAWVLQAERDGLDYGLRLPGREISPGQGAAHQAQCLEALALC